MPRILIVEDEPSLREMLRANLENEGFDVATAEDGGPALKLHKTNPVDMWILDLMLPEVDGFKALATLRQAGDSVPVLLLTARSEEIDRIQGFRLGADDYLTKPFSILELVGRTRAILRRVIPHSFSAKARMLHTGPFRIFPQRMEVRRGKKEVPLGDREFRLLEVLVSHPGRTHTRMELLSLAWEPDARPGPRTVDAHIASLRRKLGDPEKNPFLLTVGGEGYRWTAPVEAETGMAGAAMDV